MHRYHLVLGLLACLLLPVAGTAADHPALVAASGQQLAVYRLVRDFHAQTLLAGDPERAAELRALIAAQDKQAGALATPTGNAAADAALKRAVAEWPVFRKLALGNNIATDGYTDYNLSADLGASAERLDKALGEAVAALQTDKDLLAIHAANVSLQKISAAYLKRSAQTSSEIGVADDIDLAAETRQLDSVLTPLMQRLGGKPEVAPVLREVRSKWDFIKPRLLDFNTRTVPYIVDRYARQISEGLQRVSTQLAAD